MIVKVLIMLLLLSSNAAAAASANVQAGHGKNALYGSPHGKPVGRGR